MKLPVFSIKDNLVGFGSPFTASNKAVAVRGFTNSIIREYEKGVRPDVNPDDLILYHIGEFDTSLGVLSSCEPHPLSYGHTVYTEFVNNNCDSMDNSGGVLNGSEEV